MMRYIRAIHADDAAVSRNQPDNHVKTGGFAGAVRAKQTDHLSGLYLDADVTDYRPFTVRFLQIFSAEHLAAIWMDCLRHPRVGQLLPVPGQARDFRVPAQVPGPGGYAPGRCHSRLRDLQSAED